MGSRGRRILAAKRSHSLLARFSTGKDWHELSMKHVVDSQQFSKKAMDAIFAEALKMEGVRPGTPESEMLKGYVVSTLFYEPSTRTRLSFESAMGKLGGTIISTESAAEYSSAAKGETLEGEEIVRALIALAEPFPAVPPIPPQTPSGQLRATRMASSCATSRKAQPAEQQLLPVSPSSMQEMAPGSTRPRYGAGRVISLYSFAWDGPCSAQFF